MEHAFHVLDAVIEGVVMELDLTDMASEETERSRWESEGVQRTTDGPFWSKG